MQKQSVDQSKPRQGALTRVKEIHQNRRQRARELKQQGKTVIGYLCSFPPVEILTAADPIPCRILGNRQEIEIAATVKESARRNERQEPGLPRQRRLRALKIFSQAYKSKILFFGG